MNVEKGGNKMDTQLFSKKNHYEEVLRFKHTDIKAVLKNQMYVKTPLLSLYKLALFGVTLFGGAFLGFYVASGNLKKAIGALLISIIGSAVMIFFHEVLHGLAYKIIGAKRILLHFEWKKFVFYAAADKHVLDKKAFYFVALLPLILIFTLLYLGMRFLPSYAVTFSLLMVWHFLTCSGDIAMSNYFYAQKGQKLYIYDDIETKECVIVREKVKK